MSDEYPDWEVVLLFYAALHRVQEHAVLSGGEVPRRHGQRLDYVMRRLHHIRDDYHALFLLSLRARYEADLEITAEIRDAAEGMCMRILAALP